MTDTLDRLNCKVNEVFLGITRMKLAIVLTDRTFSQGQNRWRIDFQGRWSVYLWGWWPTGVNPRGQFIAISADGVPNDIKQAATRNS